MVKKKPVSFKSIRWPLITLALLWAISLTFSRQPSQNSKAPAAPSGTVVYELVSLEHYEDSGRPYLHDIYTNNTGRTIAQTQRGMLAYDRAGQPLQLRWNILSSKEENTYLYLCTSTEHLSPGGTRDTPGGWSLYDGPTMPDWAGDGRPNQVAYALYCDKEITFTDGSVWKNPDFESWLTAYEGKPVSIETLEHYYPFVQTLAGEADSKK